MIRYGDTNKPIVDPNDLVSVIESKVDQAEQDTSSWEDKQRKYHRLRMRIKKPKNFPFPNSSNLRMPTAEIFIRKGKAAIHNVIFGIRPVVAAKPSPGGSEETARKIEKLIDHLAMDVMGLRKEAVKTIDQTLEKGFFLNKVYWRREIETRQEELDVGELPLYEAAAFFMADVGDIVQEIFARKSIDTHDVVIDGNIEAVTKAVEKMRESGKTKLSIMVEDVVYDFPDVALVEPERCYVPSVSPSDPQDCEFISHEFFMHIEDIKRNAEQKGWSKASVDALCDVGSTDLDDKQIDMDRDTREGISTFQKSRMVKVCEYYGYEDIDGNGVKEKCVVTYARDFKLELRKVRLDTYSMKYPFVKFVNELTTDRWFSHRGVPDLLEDIIKEIDVQHNMKIDYQTTCNAPMFVYRSGMVNPKTLSRRLNAAIPVKGTQALSDIVQALNFHNPNVEFSYEREQLLLETKATELIGQTDFALQSLINKREPRTLGEVQLQQQSNQSVFSLDAQLFIESFGELFSMIYELWVQYGPDEYEFIYFGEDPVNGETVKLSKEEIQNKYTIVVRGNDTNTNPSVRLQKAQQILAAVTNPVLIQTGVVSPQQIAAGVAEFFKELDISSPERFINVQPVPDQSAQQIEQQKLLANMVGKNFKELTSAEQAQILSQIGIDPDVDGRDAAEEEDNALKEAEFVQKLGMKVG